MCNEDPLMSLYAAHEPYHDFECISKHPRYGDPFRLGGNLYIRPSANCVDQ